MKVRVELNDAHKTYTFDQDKILSPEDTVRHFKEKLKKVNLDILKRTIRIDNGRLDIPIYFSICGKDAHQIIGTKKQMGKGGTPSQSEASAVMELAERFSFFSFVKNPDNFFTERFCDLKDKATAISFDMIARSVHDDSDDLPVARKIFENLPLKWTWAYNLTRQQETLVPFDWFFSINEFNGPSAGNCAEEAISQGICEIIERHTSSVISHQRLKVPAIRLDSATDPLVVEMIGKYRKAGVKLFATDFTLDTGIPSVGVLAYDPATFPELSEIVWTAGTTPDPQKALSRALTEVAQLAGDFDTAANYVASGLPKFTELAEAEYVMNPGKEINIDALPNLSDDNIKIEVENCLEALANIGMEVFLINTQHQDLQIPAFYTIIPGAHFRERALGTSVGMFASKHITDNRGPQEAVAELEKIDQSLPDKYYVKFYIGSCHIALGDPDAAMHCFEEALNLGQQKGNTGFPVMEHGELVGIITNGDIIRLLNKFLGLGEEGVRITIEGLGARLGEVNMILSILDRHRAPILSLMTRSRREKQDLIALIRLKVKDATAIVEDLSNVGFEVTYVSKPQPQQAA